jgi:hypothetical protein
MNAETSQELRGLVREVLRETLAKRVTPAQGIEAVDLSTEAALQAFVSRLATPGVIEAVRAGKLRFTLSKAKMESAPISVSGAVIEGVINERRVDSLAGAGKLILGPTAVLTPLARDRARKLGLKIERSR